jgi:Skp family chaperone for outer membrane proteins
MKTRIAIVVLLSATSAFAQQLPAAPARGRAAAPPAAAQAGPPTAPFPAGAKIAFVNLQYIAANTAEGKVANNRVSALVQKKQAEIAANKNLQDSQRLQQEAQNEVQKLQADLQAEFQKKLMPILTLLAQEKHLSLLMSAGDAGLIWAEPGLDLTAEAIKRLDASTAKK